MDHPRSHYPCQGILATGTATKAERPLTLETLPGSRTSIFKNHIVGNSQMLRKQYASRSK